METVCFESESYHIVKMSESRMSIRTIKVVIVVDPKFMGMLRNTIHEVGMNRL